MDPTSRFFSRLKHLSVTLEAETRRLQQVFESRKDEPDSETTAKAMRTYHELNFNMGSLKAQVQEQLVQQRAGEDEVNIFIQACRTTQQKVSRDVQTLKTHWEEYGYQAPSKAQEVQDEGPEGEESAEREAGGQEEDGEDFISSPPAAPTFSDVMRTPQLSDFGLSEMQLKRHLAGAEWCSEVPPMPEMILPHPVLSTPAPPLLPLTPKRVLRMEDEELQTPQMHDFGISEDDDFTMKLLQKNNAEENHRPEQDQPGPAGNSVLNRFQTRDEIPASPELPVLCTPGLKIRKTNGRSSSPEPDSGEPGSPPGPDLPRTPQVPAFQTPYMTRLVSTKKSFRQPEPIGLQSEEELPASPPKGAPLGGSKRCWEDQVLEVCEAALGDQQMPEMPNLESVLGNSLQRRNPKVLKLGLQQQPVVEVELDGATQEFSLGTPRIRSSFQEPGTPEMPDLSSVTQDICKLVSQAQPRRTVTSVEPEEPRSRSEVVSVVSDGEFQSLPGYLRQVTLHSLNQAVNNINAFTQQQRPEGSSEFQMDQLKRIIGVGTLAPVYVLCLTELKRLKHVGGVKENSVYKLINNH